MNFITHFYILLFVCNVFFRFFFFAADIYDEVSSSIQPLGLDTECIGGGRIEHRPDAKRLKVYGYSQVC